MGTGKDPPGKPCSIYSLVMRFSTIVRTSHACCALQTSAAPANQISIESISRPQAKNDELREGVPHFSAKVNHYAESDGYNVDIRFHKN